MKFSKYLNEDTDVKGRLEMLDGGNQRIILWTALKGNKTVILKTKLSDMENLTISKGMKIPVSANVIWS